MPMQRWCNNDRQRLDDLPGLCGPWVRLLGRSLRRDGALMSTRLRRALRMARLRLPMGVFEAVRPTKAFGFYGVRNNIFVGKI